MAKKTTDDLRKAIEEANLPSEDVNDLFEYLISLQSQGSFVFKNFVFRTHEHFHNRFLINKVIDFGQSKRPQIVFEISDVGKEKGKPHFFTYWNAINQLQNVHEETALNEIKQTISKLTQEVFEVKSESQKLRNENELLKDYIFGQISKPSTDSSEQIQHIPVSIYLDTNNSSEIFNVYSSVLDFLNTINFNQTIELKPIKGSWFKKLIASSKSAMTSKEVTDRLKEAEYGVEVNTILKPQSEVDKNNSEALLNILKSVENIPNAAIRIGSLIVVKVTNVNGDTNIQVRTLSIKELHLLNKKPELLTKPSEVLTALAKEISDSNNQQIISN